MFIPGGGREAEEAAAGAGAAKLRQAKFQILSQRQKKKNSLDQHSFLFIFNNCTKVIMKLEPSK